MSTLSPQSNTISQSYKSISYVKRNIIALYLAVGNQPPHNGSTASSVRLASTARSIGGQWFSYPGGHRPWYSLPR